MAFHNFMRSGASKRHASIGCIVTIYVYSLATQFASLLYYSQGPGVPVILVWQIWVLLVNSSRSDRDPGPRFQITGRRSIQVCSRLRCRGIRVTVPAGMARRAGPRPGPPLKLQVTQTWNLPVNGRNPGGVIVVRSILRLA